MRNETLDYLGRTRHNYRMNITDPISIEDAAKIACLSARRIRILAEEKRIRATKIGRVWIVSRRSAESFAPGPIGRPKNPEKSSK